MNPLSKEAKPVKRDLETRPSLRPSFPKTKSRTAIRSASSEAKTVKRDLETRPSLRPSFPKTKPRTAILSASSGARVMNCRLRNDRGVRMRKTIFAQFPLVESTQVFFIPVFELSAIEFLADTLIGQRDQSPRGRIFLNGCEF